jgi:L,D-transpeptidase ErfK/SrfK
MTRLLLFIVSVLIWTRPVTGADPAGQIVGGKSLYSVRHGDSLRAIGARLAVDVSVLAADNALSVASALRVGQQLQVDNRHIVPHAVPDGIIINIPQRMLFFFKDGELRKHFPVGLGRPDWPTPTGKFTIMIKEQDPTWDVPPSIQEEMRRAGKPVQTCVPPGPDNPLGKHWLGLSIAGIGIHGTIAPSSIYRFQTHGCIRAHPDDIAELFRLVSRGTTGMLVYRPVLISSIGEDVYLEVHPDVYRRESDPWARFDQYVQSTRLEFVVDRTLARAIIRKQEGIARKVSNAARANDDTTSRRESDR